MSVLLAMVQIVENWACITGMVLASHLPGEAASAAHPSLEIAIEKIADIKGFRNLVTKKEGDRIEVFFPGGLSDESRALAGKRVTLPVRAAPGQRYFAAPDWTMEKGSSRCGGNP